MKHKLLLLLACLLATVTASAENYILYTSSDGNVVRPYNYNAFGVKIISNTYENGQGKLLFDGEVTTIGKDAFYSCSNLTEVEIPASVTTIGEQAFFWCESLRSVVIPATVTTIGEQAFYGCSRLPVEDNLRYADTYLVGAADKTLTSYNIKAGTRFIGTSAFNNCSSLTSLEIPTSVVTIGNSAFCGCSSLTSVVIPNSVTTIGNFAFEHCI